MDNLKKQRGLEEKVDGEQRGFSLVVYREAGGTVLFLSYASFAFRTEHLFSILTVTSHAFITPLSKILLRP